MQHREGLNAGNSARQLIIGQPSVRATVTSSEQTVQCMNRKPSSHFDRRREGPNAAGNSARQLIRVKIPAARDVVGTRSARTTYLQPVHRSE